MRALISRFRPVLRKAAYPALYLAAPRGPRRISAMVRVHDEEEFLAASILSVVDVLDEVVLIDNNSTDATPEIIDRLAARYPTRIRTFRYPHTIARAGAENRALASSPGGSRSPRLLANYYNWCLQQCANDWVIKWDADMVATPQLAAAIATFSSRRQQVMRISGANVYSSTEHFIAHEGYFRPIEFYEPRIFARRFARYEDHGGDYESLSTPYQAPEWSVRYEPLTYVHLKYCKHDPSANNTPEGQPLASQGAVLEPHLAAVARWAMAGRGSVLLTP